MVNLPIHEKQNTTHNFAQTTEMRKQHYKTFKGQFILKEFMRIIILYFQISMPTNFQV